jgi:hypothetical protein
MRRTLFIVLSVIVVSVASCATNQEKKAAEEGVLTLEPPGPLDDEWSRGLVGEWEISAESDLKEFKNWVKGKGRMRAVLGLGEQFLIVKMDGVTSEISEEYSRYLRDTAHASEQDIEALRNLAFEHLELRTIDPTTGAVVGYLFDSWRCVAQGTGTRKGNTEVMEWEWSVGGRGTSVRTTERISDDKLTATEIYTLADGSTMEDRAQMIRRR